MKYTFILFVLISLAEVIVFIQVGEWLGVGLTILSVIATAAIGIALLKAQGLATLARVQRKATSGEIPGQELIEGVLLLLAGAFLLTPGFLTDAFGFILLTPPLRGQFARWAIAKGLMQSVQQGGSSQFNSSFSNSQFSSAFQDTKDHEAKTQPFFEHGPKAGYQHNPDLAGSKPETQHAGKKTSQAPPVTIDGKYERKD